MVVLASEKCIHCGACRQYCREGAIESSGGRMHIIRERCTDCGKCIKACYMAAIRRTNAPHQDEAGVPARTGTKQ